MKPSHDYPTARQQRCAAPIETCNSWPARLGRAILYSISSVRDWLARHAVEPVR